MKAGCLREISDGKVAVIVLRQISGGAGRSERNDLSRITHTTVIPIHSARSVETLKIFDFGEKRGATFRFEKEEEQENAWKQ